MASLENVPSLNTAVTFIVESATKITDLMNSIEEAKSVLDTSVHVNQSIDSTHATDRSQVTDHAIQELNISINTASDSIRELSETAHTNAESYENVLETVGALNDYSLLRDQGTWRDCPNKYWVIQECS